MSLTIYQCDICGAAGMGKGVHCYTISTDNDRFPDDLFKGHLCDRCCEDVSLKWLAVVKNKKKRRVKKITDNEIMDFIFKTGKLPLSGADTNFQRALDQRRREEGYPWKTGEPYDYMAMGIYIGIKHALSLKKESGENA